MSQRVELPLAFVVVTLLGVGVTFGVLRVWAPDRLRQLRGTPEERKKARTVAGAAIGAGLVSGFAGGSLVPGAESRSFLAWIAVAGASLGVVSIGLWVVVRWSNRTFGKDWSKKQDLTLSRPLPDAPGRQQVAYVAWFVLVFVVASLVLIFATEHVVF